LACLAVVSALAGDVVGPVLGAGASPLGHLRGALSTARPVGDRLECASGSAEVGEQQRTAGGGDVGLPGRRPPDQCAVGQLLIGPVPECLDQMMAAITRRTLRFKARSQSSRLVIRHWIRKRQSRSQPRSSELPRLDRRTWDCARRHIRSQIGDTTDEHHSHHRRRSACVAVAHRKLCVRDRARTTEAAEAFGPDGLSSLRPAQISVRPGHGSCALAREVFGQRREGARSGQVNPTGR